MPPTLGETFAKVNDAVHIAIGVGVVLGPFLFPAKYMPIFVVFPLAILYRLHDHCPFSEITRTIHALREGCDKPFGIHSEIAWIYDALGLDVPKDEEFFMIATSSVLMFSATIAFVRMSRHYNICLIPNNKALVATAGILIYVIVAEVIIAQLPEAPLCAPRATNQ